MTAKGLLLVALGGALGSILRYALAVGAAARLGPAFPWGTLAANVIGAFVIGMVAEVPLGPLPPAAKLFVATGICGGLTTFSTLALEGVTLTRGGGPGAGLGYLAGSVGLGVAAVLAGGALARALAGVARA